MSDPKALYPGFLFVLMAIMLLPQNLRAQAISPTSGKPYTESIPGTDVHFKMVPIQGGMFTTGSPADEKGRRDDEGPQFRVKISPFYMGQHEVTWPEYRAYAQTYFFFAQHPRRPPIPQDQLADAVTYPTPIYDMEWGPVLYRMGGAKAGLPAVGMSQYAARQYTKWLSKLTGRFYRLPTEAEWEYACRAGTTTAYSFGKNAAHLGDFGWYEDNSNEKDGDPGYHPIGTKKANPWGLYDMSGNVAEWCLDQYAADWYMQFAGKTVDWRQAVNWPLHRYPTVLRGGGFDSEATDCRSAARLHSTRDFNKVDPQFPKSPFWESFTPWVGFRIVSPITPPSDEEKHRCWDAIDAQIEQDTHRDRDIHELVTPATVPAKR